jgi:hypothetical protein
MSTDGTAPALRGGAMSISTSPVLRLRWKLVMSSSAFHRQNSTSENTRSERGRSLPLVSRSRCTSAAWPSGTNIVSSAAMPRRSPRITL